MHTKVSVLIAVALTLGSTSAALAQGNGDGGPFDAGGFHGSGFGGEDHRGADFNRKAYQRGGFQGNAINATDCSSLLKSRSEPDYQRSQC
jgi:hypothetical protein